MCVCVCASCSEASVAGVCASVARVDPLSTGPNSVQVFCYINQMLIQKMRGITPAGTDRWRAAAGWWLPVWPLASPQPGRHPSLLSCTCSLHTSRAFHTWICLHLFGSKLGSGISLHLLAACEHLFCCLRWLIIKLKHFFRNVLI